jgi:predicted metalloprotease
VFGSLVGMKKRRVIGGVVVLAALAAAALHHGSASADETTSAPATTSAARELTLGSSQPRTMDDFLTGVLKDVDGYWTQQFASAGLPEPRVSYAWIPAGQSVQSACGTESDSAAAYCPGDDTIYVSDQFADGIYQGAFDGSLPGASQGYGSAVGDFAVAYIVAHEYGHQVQTELGAYDQYGQSRPTMDFELQADCYAGTWAKSAADRNELDDGDVQEALDAALAVGDFDTSSPGHHGTPDQREQAWRTGFESGSPDSCGSYLAAT